MLISRIDKVTLYVNSQEEARKFWTEKVGFTVILEQPMGPGMTWLEVGPEGTPFPTSFVLYPKETMLQQKPEMVAHPSVILASEHVDALRQRLVERGVQAEEVQMMPWGKTFAFLDQDGNRFMVRG